MTGCGCLCIRARARTRAPFFTRSHDASAMLRSMPSVSLVVMTPRESRYPAIAANSGVPSAYVPRSRMDLRSASLTRNAAEVESAMS